MIVQIIIGITGVSAIWLSQSPHLQQRKWASAVGLVGQPFWFIAMYQAEQWGILVLCCFYTISWVRGFYHHWIKQDA